VAAVKAKMKVVFRGELFALSSLCIIPLLAGCGGLRQAQDDTQPPIGASGAMERSSPSAARPDLVKSWIDKTSSAQELLYVTDNSGTVKIYSFPRHNLSGLYRA
jgi:hypothetical protein